jgi:hypothetical protein
VAFGYGTSRADKEWPLAHWVALIGGSRLAALRRWAWQREGIRCHHRDIAAQLKRSDRVADVAAQYLTAALAGCRGVVAGARKTHKDTDNFLSFV